MKKVSVFVVTEVCFATTRHSRLPEAANEAPLWSNLAGSSRQSEHCIQLHLLAPSTCWFPCRH